MINPEFNLFESICSPTPLRASGQVLSPPPRAGRLTRKFWVDTAQNAVVGQHLTVVIEPTDP